MMLRKLFVPTVAAVGLLLTAQPTRAAQSYDNCTNFVTSVPATIATQGTWCFNKDLSTSIGSGAAVTINANNVTLDCNDFKLGGLGAGAATQTIGIASSTRSNITVRNCNIRGFFKGIEVGSGSGGNHLIENNRLDNNTWIGLDIVGDGSVIRGNRISGTGGTTVPANTIKAVGIYAAGDVEILDNLISGVYAAAGTNGYAVGVNPGSNMAGSVIGNNIKNVIADGTGWAYAISFFDDTGRVSVDSNNLIGPGVANSIAVWCPEENNVLLVGNVASGWANAGWQCAHDGGNTVVP